MEEFEDALTLLIKQMDISIKQNDIRDIAQSLDLNRDGMIDFNEFLEAFRIVDSMGKDNTERINRQAGQPEHNKLDVELSTMHEEEQQKKAPDDSQC